MKLRYGKPQKRQKSTERFCYLIGLPGVVNPSVRGTRGITWCPLWRYLEQFNAACTIPAVAVVRKTINIRGQDLSPLQFKTIGVIVGPRKPEALEVVSR